MISKVYRFNNTIALTTDNGTLYLHYDTAKSLIDALKAATEDMEDAPRFSESTLGTIDLQPLTQC